MKVARLMILGVAVVAGGFAAWLANRSPDAPAPPPPVAEDKTEILVTAKEMPVGNVLSAGDLTWQSWPKTTVSSEDVLRTEQPDAREHFEGYMVRVPIPKGWPVRPGNLIDAKVKVLSAGYMAATLPQGKRAVSTDVTVETGAGGFILPSDHVDVIFTRRVRDIKTGIENTVTETLARDVLVRAIDQTTEERNGAKTVVGKTATLEVTPRQVEQIARARQVGTLTLALRSLVDSGASTTADDISLIPIAENGTLDGTINVCRPLDCTPFSGISPLRILPLGGPLPSNKPESPRIIEAQRSAENN